MAQTASPDLSTVSVLIIADIRFYREGLARALPTYPDLQPVTAVSGGSEALRALRLNWPDLVLMDNALSGGLELVREIGALGTGARIVVLTVTGRPEDLLDWAEAGVAGYVGRDESLDDLVGVIRRAVRGEFACSPTFAGRMLQRIGALASLVPGVAATTAGQLTAREVEILELIRQGRSNKYIAGRLGVSLPTVKNHVHSILAKLNVGRRGEAAALHLENSPLSNSSTSRPGSGSEAVQTG
jgi:two-component system, NarL family, nitrate/nitrite response regulator NarL